MRQRNGMISFLSGSFLLMLACGSVHATVVPFTEHFNSGASNWFNPDGTAPANWIAAGGPDGSGYISSSFNFVNQSPAPIPNNAVNLFRAQDEFNSSNHSFEGDWLASGVTQFSFWVRQHASVAMNFFVRFATAANFPAWSGVEFTPVQPNQWTQITIDISFDNPNLFFEGPSPTLADFNNVFGNIGHVQIGVFGGELAGVDQDVAFDLDEVSLVPAPGVIAAMGLCALFGSGRNRTRTHRCR